MSIVLFQLSKVYKKSHWGVTISVGYFQVTTRMLWLYYAKWTSF